MKLQTYSDGTRILIKEDADGNRVSATRVEKGATTESIKATAISMKDVAVSQSIINTMPSLISEEEIDTNEEVKQDGQEGGVADTDPITDDTGTGTPDSGDTEPIK